MTDDEHATTGFDSRQGRKVVVWWNDAVSDSGQMHPDDAGSTEPLVMKTAGWLVSRDDSAIRVAQSITENGDYVDILTIPSGAIREVSQKEGGGK